MARWSSGFHTIAFTIVRSLGEGRQCLIHMERILHLHMFEDPSCVYVGTQISQQMHLLRVCFSS